MRTLNNKKFQSFLHQNFDSGKLNVQATRKRGENENEKEREGERGIQFPGKDQQCLRRMQIMLQQSQLLSPTIYTLEKTEKDFSNLILLKHKTKVQKNDDNKIRFPQPK